MDMSGNGEFWGIIFTTGICHTAKGTPDIYYNGSAITDLSNKWALTLSLVSNTWRETRP